jgi:nitroreductase/NAD-dependent dihydropyrimidine dehydrogenase PreA subunit
MVEITIDADVCKKDGLCAMACTYGIFQQEEEGTIPKIDEVMLKKCYRCGHCVAICPHGAISHSHFPKGTVNPIDLGSLPSYDQVLELIRSRRSKRLFKDMPVQRDVLEKVLEAARFAPSQHNDQSTEFIVIQDKEILREITALTAEGIGKLAGYTRNPIGRMMMRRALGRRGAAYVAELAPEMEGLVSLFKSGTDWILREAPVLVLFCADSAGGSFAGINANLALHNAALAAETVGLGCFYAGFVVTVGERDDRIASLVSLPETHMIYGALAMGYPQLTFKKWPERNPAKVKWVGAD